MDWNFPACNNFQTYIIRDDDWSQCQGRCVEVNRLHISSRRKLVVTNPCRLTIMFTTTLATFNSRGLFLVSTPCTRYASGRSRATRCRNLLGDSGYCRYWNSCDERSAQESILKTAAIRFPNFWQTQYYTAYEPHRAPPDQQLLQKL